MISSPGCVCRGAVFPGRISTIAWTVSCPAMLRSCRCRSMRFVVGCCACAACNAQPVAATSAATAMNRVVFMRILIWEGSGRRLGSLRVPERSERGGQLGREELGLLPCGEVSALVDLVEVSQLGIGAPRPCLRGSIDVLRKYRDGDRQRDLGGLLRARGNDAASCAVFPVQPRRRRRGDRQPVQRDVVEHVVFGRQLICIRIVQSVVYTWLCDDSTHED